MNNKYQNKHHYAIKPGRFKNKKGTVQFKTPKKSTWSGGRRKGKQKPTQERSTDKEEDADDLTEAEIDGYIQNDKKQSLFDTQVFFTIAVAYCFESTLKRHLRLVKMELFLPLGKI